MVCIYCHEKTKVINSRSTMGNHSTWRRRKCSTCSAIFTTSENVDLERSLRVTSNKNKSLEPFYREKLLISISNSLLHLNKPENHANSLTDTIILKLLSQSKNGLIDKQDITSVTLSVLKNFDKPAATYYSAHHIKTGT